MSSKRETAREVADLLALYEAESHNRRCDPYDPACQNPRLDPELNWV